LNVIGGVPPVLLFLFFRWNAGNGVVVASTARRTIEEQLEATEKSPGANEEVFAGQ
jgi:hypothetical protein